MEFTLLDWAIMIGYVLVTLGVGFAFSRRAGKSLDEFFISGRSLPWWIAGTSMVATTFAADTPLAVTGLVIKHGLAGNWVWWAFAFGGMITVFVYARLWRRSEVVTDVELVELRYSGKPAAALRAIRAIYVALIVNSIIIGWVCGAMLTFFETTILSEPLAGSISEGIQSWWLLVAFLIFVGVYSSLSGMWGVAITDAVQFVLAMAGCILLAIVAVQHFGDADALREKVTAQFRDGERSLQFLPDFSSGNSWLPLHAFLIIALVQWWATWYPGAEPGGGGFVVQRMASCKDERHSMLATLWYQLAHYCLRPWPWIIVAFAALAMYPELRQQYLDNNQFDPGKGYPMVIRDLAPSGLRGLMMVTFLAAFMSTISTQINWGASYLVRDLYQRFVKPDAEARHYARVSRFASALILLCGGLATWTMKDYSIDTIWNILLALGAGTGSTFMLRWFWWRINAWSEIVAMLSSLLFFLLIGSEQAKLPTEMLIVATPQLKILIVALLSIACWVLATLLTRPESVDHLRAFYRKIRPAGPGWRPIAQQCPEVVTDRDLGQSLFAAFAGSTFIYSMLPLTGFIIFADYENAAISGTVAVISGLLTIIMVRRLTR